MVNTNLKPKKQVVKNSDSRKIFSEVNFTPDRYRVLLMKYFLEIEQDAQDKAIAKNESLIKEMNEKLTKLSDLRTNPIESDAKNASSAGPSDDFYAKLQEHDRRLRTHDTDIRNCVSWEQLNQSFMIDFFNEEGKDNCETERKGYQYYFNGLQTLSELGTKIDEMLRDGGTASESLASIKSRMYIIAMSTHLSLVLFLANLH